MKIQPQPLSKQSASVLVISCFLMGILAVSIGGYMFYVAQQTSLGARAQTWNAALIVSEAGIEEGLQALNGGMASATGWSQNGNVYTRTRTMASGSTYTITNDLTSSTAPVITSRGSMQTVTLTRNDSPVIFAIVGVNVASATNISRAIRVRTYKGSSFLAAMVAKHKIDMNGNYVTADSYDSSDATKSTGGRYDATKAQDNGDVASNDGIVNAVSAGNANIYGHVSTGPGGTVQIGVNGAIGTHTWQATHTGAQSGYVLDNANFTFPDVSLPYSGGLYPGPGDIVSMIGTTTNSISIVGTNVAPGTPPAGQYYGPVTIHTNSSTSTNYPGSQPNLVTNTSWLTVTTYPGNIAGISTNCVSYTTVTAYPGSQRCMTTNCSSPAVKIKNQPTTNYCGVAPWQGQGADNNWWYYYPIASYTYANVLSYTYPVYTYSYSTYTYDYVIYYAVPLYQTNHYDHVIVSGDYYYAPTFNGSTYVSGTARLVLPSGLNMSGGDLMTIANGAALTIYSGDDTTVSGQGVLNVSGRAASFTVYSMGDDFTLNGNGTFTGILVAPYADVRMNGGGTGLDDFSGALLANKITMNGRFNFHYDEALGRLGGTGRYLITSWDELQ